MTKENFDEEKMFSPEQLIEQLHLKVDKTFAEFTSRREEFIEFLEDFSAPHTENRVWFELLKGGGKYYMLELPPFLHISASNLYKILDKLKRRGLVKMIGNRYQAVSPEAFIREKRTRA